MHLVRRAGLVSLPGLICARAAAAHALILRSTPAAGAVLAALPPAASLGFNSRIDPARSRLTLIGPDGVAWPLALAPGDDATRLEASLGAVPPAPGPWRLRWQVLAADGHITRGDIAFSLDPGRG